jgi:hypothetical protein
VTGTVTAGAVESTTLVPALAPFVPCHASSTDPSLFVTLTLAGVGSVVVGGLAAVVALRRRSPSRILVALAVGALVARTAVGGLTVAGAIPDAPHHTLEHGLDVVLVGLVLAAACVARRAERRTPDADGGERA